MFGNLGRMMKLAGQMRTKLPEMQKKLAASEFAGEAGGGLVEATVNGRMQIVRVKIDPQVVADGDVEMLEDLVKAAVAAAQHKAAQAAEQAMKQLTGGMDIAGMEKMLGM
jgi:hypothetical protein